MNDAARKAETHCRLARTRDSQILARMSRDYIETGLGWSWRANRIDRFIHAPDCVVVCAEHLSASAGKLESQGRDICGFAIMEFGIDKAHLNLLAVVPSMRRHGIARTLLTWLEKSAEVAGTAQIDLEVRATNSAAQQFYEALGYQRCGTVPSYYNGREAAHRFHKNLFAPPNPEDAKPDAAKTDKGAKQP